MKNKYELCARCLMDTSDPDIEFDEKGHCNHCRELLQMREHFQLDGSRKDRLEQIVAEIKEQGKGKNYDCIVGVSGGVDSTYVAYLVTKLGLRTLAVHVDNGWNSELAVNNIEKVLKKLNIDLYTHVIDWEEFRQLQLAFLRASVSDAEIPTDHAIRAVLNRVAVREKVQYVINGRNFFTEGILPWSWTYSALDWKYIRCINKRFGLKRLRKYPHMSLFYLFYSVFIRRVKLFSILNYVNYNKKDAMALLKKDLGWKDYGGKHYESIYTRFFQAYILPVKFGFDKRKAHLSVLVCTGQITRENALKNLKCPPDRAERVAEDKTYVIKKLGLSVDQFENIMSLETRHYSDYPNNSHFFLIHNNRFLFSLLKLLKRLHIIPEGFADHVAAT